MLTEGDIISSNGCYYYVKKCGSSGIRAINLSRGTNSTITDEDNIFGMPTYMKLVSMFGGMQCAGFNGMNPMMMTMCDNDSKEFDPMMMMVMCGMFNGNNGMFGTNMVQQQFQPQQNCANTDETIEE